MSNKDDFFLKQMKGVSPIKKSNRVKKEEPKPKSTNLRKKKINNKNLFLNHDKELTQSGFVLEKIDIKKNIKRGVFKINKKIDFHGKNLLSSEEKFISTIQDCYNNGTRCLLFVTGKGLFKSKKTENNHQPKLYNSVIRSAFLNWVKSNKYSKYILSFEKASIEHGGDGAFYVYLRKRKN